MSHHYIVTARNEDELYDRLESLKAKGYQEKDVHVISSNKTQMKLINKHTDVNTHETATTMDRFKSWFTGEDTIVESLKKLDLTESEAEKYRQDVTSGGILLVVDQYDQGDPVHDTLGASGNSYESYHDGPGIHGETVQPEERTFVTPEPGYEDRQHETKPMGNQKEEL